MFSAILYDIMFCFWTVLTDHVLSLPIESPGDTYLHAYVCIIWFFMFLGWLHDGKDVDPRDLPAVIRLEPSQFWRQAMNNEQNNEQLGKEFVYR